jgi:hypothetical protein
MLAARIPPAHPTSPKGSWPSWIFASKLTLEREVGGGGSERDYIWRGKKL